MVFPYLFYPLVFLMVIVCVTAFLLIFTTKATTEQITKISGGVSICLALAALMLSVYSTYFVFDQSKVPNLELEVKFIELSGTLPAERAPILSQLGGIYQLSIKNVGDKDAVSAWLNGRVQLKEKVGENIDQLQLQYHRVSKGTGTNPYPLKQLMPSSSYNMSVAASCANCLENKQWWVEIDTKNRSVSVRPLPIGRGMWQKVDLW